MLQFRARRTIREMAEGRVWPVFVCYLSFGKEQKTRMIPQIVGAVFIAIAFGGLFIGYRRTKRAD